MLHLFHCFVYQCGIQVALNNGINSSSGGL